MDSTSPNTYQIRAQTELKTRSLNNSTRLTLAGPCSVKHAIDKDLRTSGLGFGVPTCF